jgi:hypothetical protein
LKNIKFESLIQINSQKLKDYGHNWNLEGQNWCNQGFSWKKFEDWRLIDGQIEEFWEQWPLCKKCKKLRIQLKKDKGDMARNSKD